jgi:hypothetical protein
MDALSLIFIPKLKLEFLNLIYCEPIVGNSKPYAIEPNSIHIFISPVFNAL